MEDINYYLFITAVSSFKVIIKSSKTKFYTENEF